MIGFALLLGTNSVKWRWFLSLCRIAVVRNRMLDFIAELFIRINHSFLQHAVRC